MLNLKGRHFLSLHDFSPEEVLGILDTADTLKSRRLAGPEKQTLVGKTVAMIFQKPSTRTRVSFQAGISHLGASAIMLSPNDSQMGRGEPLSDTAQVLSRFVDAIVARVFSHDDLDELARHASVPVINALSDLTHPCQVLADLQTIREKFGKLKGLKMAYLGDGNNMTHSLMLGCAKVGMDIAVATPADFAPNATLVQQAIDDAADSRVTIGTDPSEAVQGADVVVTDCWASMGQEDEHDKRIAPFQPYQVNAALVAQASPDAIVMHCLPAYRGEEITAEVIDGPQSVIFDEAENRLHAQKALLQLLIAG